MLGAVVIMVRVVLPLPVTEGGTKLQVLSAGRPVHEKVTVPVNPFVAATESIAVPVCPGLDIVIVAGLNERLKFGPVLAELKPFARLSASTEPRPVTRLNPLAASALEASNPRMPDEGHWYEAGILEGVPASQLTMLLPLVT